MTLEQIVMFCAERNPTHEEIQTLVVATGGTPDHALGVLSLEVARRYMSGALAFEPADAIMNALFAHATKALQEWPEPMYSVYLAFDGGEYRHPGDDPETDPKEKYTRPQLAAILGDMNV